MCTALKKDSIISYFYYLLSMTRYAMKVMSEKAAWDALLEVFAARARTSDYLPGDEVAYTRYGQI